MKRINIPKEVVRALELLDQANIDVCSDVILLDGVLETCTRHQETRRLEKVATISPSRVFAPSSLSTAPHHTRRQNFSQNPWVR